MSGLNGHSPPSLRHAFPRLGGLERFKPGYVEGLEELQLRSRRFAEESVKPRALELDKRGGADPTAFDWDVVREGAAAGMLDLCVPSEVGGLGGLAVETAIAMEELCAACPGIANIFGAHGLGVAPLLTAGPSQWGVLEELVRGNQRGEPPLMGFAITEPDAGTDMEDLDLMRDARIVSRATPVAGGYRLSGTKRFISNGSVARYLSVMMPIDRKRPVETCTCFLVDTAAEGFEVSRIEHKMGQRACHAAELTFDGVFVPSERVVGRPGDAAGITLLVLAASRPPVGAIATGTARGALDRLLEWLHTDPAAAGLADRQYVQLRLASMAERIHLARQAYMDAATELDVAALGGTLGHPLVRALGAMPRSLRRRKRVRQAMASQGSRQATVRVMRQTTSDRAITRALGLSSMAKAYGADVAVETTSEALEIVGLTGSAIGAELDKLWRDARLTQIYEGTNQLNRLEVYRALVDREQMPILPETEELAA